MLRFESKPIAETPASDGRKHDNEVPLADDGRWERLIAEWNEKREQPRVREGGNADYVVSVGDDKDPRVRQAQLEEILALTRSSGDRVVGEELRHVAYPNPRTLLGRGVAEEVAAKARACGANMLVLDAELSPSQTRNLEDVTKLPVCDREGIILNVFLRHARTRRARICVEIAQLAWLSPRIRGVGINMDQQAAGMGAARGPGETASELLARKLDARTLQLEKALEKLSTSDDTRRAQRADAKRLVLVGYTNAGKTSLMNALAKEQLSARDAPFETLDTTSRCLTRHGGDVILSDTVGFIRRLPERLLASFESTLSEVAEATLLVIVLDASDHERELHLSTTHDVLERLGAEHIPRFYVWNKLDRATDVDLRELAALSDGHPFRAISTRDEAAVSELLHTLVSAARAGEEPVTMLVPYDASEILSLVYARCRVTETEALPEGLRLTFQGPAQATARIRARLERRSQ